MAKKKATPSVEIEAPAASSSKFVTKTVQELLDLVGPDASLTVSRKTIRTVIAKRRAAEIDAEIGG